MGYTGIGIAERDEEQTKKAWENISKALNIPHQGIEVQEMAVTFFKYLRN